MLSVTAALPAPSATSTSAAVTGVASSSWMVAVTVAVPKAKFPSR